MNIAVIPARGGSKRIPRKNIKLFHGKPMIAYAIHAAQDSGLFDRILVSSDDPEIIDVAREFGADVPFVRPNELADDYTPTIPVVAHAIQSSQALGWDVRSVCCIYPCVPFLSIADLHAAQDLFEKDNGGYIFPVTEFPSPVQYALQRLPDGSVRPLLPEYFPQNAAARTQDLQAGVFDVGQFYLASSQTWLGGESILLNGRTFMIPQSRVVDIDTTADWERAEILFTALSDKQ